MPLARLPLGELRRKLLFEGGQQRVALLYTALERARVLLEGLDFTLELCPGSGERRRSFLGRPHPRIQGNRRLAELHHLLRTLELCCAQVRVRLLEHLILTEQAVELPVLGLELVAITALALIGELGAPLLRLDHGAHLLKILSLELQGVSHVLEARRFFGKFGFELERALALPLGFLLCGGQSAANARIVFARLVKLALQAKLLEISGGVLESLDFLCQALALALALVQLLVHLLKLAVGLVELLKRVVAAQSRLGAGDIELQLLDLLLQVLSVVLGLLAERS